MDLDKQIKIKCEGKEYFDIDDLIPLQGKFKSIRQDKFNDLKKSLIKDGIVFGFHIWKNEGKIYIEDGHHRVLVLKALRSEGYFIPPIPCNAVLAKDKKEAGKAILISNSYYAEISQESLSDFMIDFDLKISDLENLDFPGLNLKELQVDFDSINKINNISDESKYLIIIDCINENEQRSYFEEFNNRGLNCKLMS